MTTNYCDHCGEVIHSENFRPYTRLPFAVSSANVGESAIVCVPCDKELTTTQGGTMPTNYTAPARVHDLLGQAYRLIEDAQAHADRWDRAELGRGLDNIRWQLGDFIAQITPLTSAHTLDPVTGEWVADDRHAFSLALEGGE